MQVDSPRKGHPTGIDGLLRESEPDGFIQVCTPSNSISLLTIAQPLSVDEKFKHLHQSLSNALTLIESQQPQMDPGWLDKSVIALPGDSSSWRTISVTRLAARSQKQMSVIGTINPSHRISWAAILGPSRVKTVGYFELLSVH